MKSKYAHQDELIPQKQELRPRVLVVEDEAIVALDFQQRLQGMGYTVTGVACNGDEALEKSYRTRPELVLMDINLGGGMSGIEAALAIRAQQDLPVIYITANSDPDTARRAASSGPFGYLLKPFEDRELDTAIQIRMVKHEMHRRLTESERRFNATLTSIVDGVIAADGFGRIAFFNPSAESITGWRKDEALGRELAELMLLRDDGTHQEGTDFFSRFRLSPGSSGLSRTALLVRRDGGTTPIEYRASYIRDDHDRLVGTVISFSDIRLRKLAEEEIRQGQEKLKNAHKTLEHKHDELQTLYHTVSHELKTPLTSAREFVSLVLEGLTGPINETQREYLTIARESCDRMRICINDMLDVTRLETGKMNVELALASVGVLARRVVSMLKPVAERKCIDLSCLIAPDVPEIMMDETRIAQVITNLLNNALKFTTGGGRVTVSVGVSPTQPDHVEITVQDTGCGIPGPHLTRIFDRLYQVHHEHASSCQGLGLGLHICQELVRLHGGDIRVESETGVGSTFYVTLPCRGVTRQATLKPTA